MNSSRLDKSKIRAGLYRHYKGKLYQVLGLAHHSETLEELVVYIACYRTRWGNKSLWVRPLKMFKENVVVDQKEIPRFAYIGSHKKISK